MPEFAATLGADRFQRESSTHRPLDHPHIFAVLDSGETAGPVVHDAVRGGESLRDRLRREGRLAVDEALRITRDAAEALQHAHEQGVIHRDVKPENLLLTRDGNTLVTDFGIARAADGDENITKGGAPMGTPAYMSPEQADGAMAVDARTDIYSLAAVLFEMLAGAPPYPGTTAMSVIAKWLSEPVPSARATRPEVPEEVDRAIRRALSRSAGGRFGTMGEFARALQGAPTGSVSTPVAPLRPRARASLLRVPAAWIALCLALITAGFFAWQYHGARPSPAPKLLAVLPFENLGDSADAYFSDGIANELRSKLSELDGVQVIARGSSNQYRGSAKPPEQIARELGVSYLLTATVQWEKGRVAERRAGCG